jgi:hypothetical protein
MKLSLGPFTLLKSGAKKLVMGENIKVVRVKVSTLSLGVLVFQYNFMVLAPSMATSRFKNSAKVFVFSSIEQHILDTNAGKQLS